MLLWLHLCHKFVGFFTPSIRLNVSFSDIVFKQPTQSNLLAKDDKLYSSEIKKTLWQKTRQHALRNHNNKRLPVDNIQTNPISYWDICEFIHFSTRKHARADTCKRAAATEQQQHRVKDNDTENWCRQAGRLEATAKNRHNGEQSELFLEQHKSHMGLTNDKQITHGPFSQQTFCLVIEGKHMCHK